jgi:hypothetical protein
MTLRADRMIPTVLSIALFLAATARFYRKRLRQ